ncbi:hypothetical protein Rctr85_083 [Virus Rctr85]|nr:hypothetical protein Rctr85_083 [Virus Rctr85]
MYKPGQRKLATLDRRLGRAAQTLSSIGNDSDAAAVREAITELKRHSDALSTSIAALAEEAVNQMDALATFRRPDPWQEVFLAVGVKRQDIVDALEGGDLSNTALTTLVAGLTDAQMQDIADTVGRSLEAGQEFNEALADTVGTRYPGLIGQSQDDDEPGTDSGLIADMADADFSQVELPDVDDGLPDGYDEPYMTEDSPDNLVQPADQE